MKVNVKVMSLSTGGPLIAVLNSKDANAWDVHLGDRIGISLDTNSTNSSVFTNSKEVVAIVDYSDDDSDIMPGMIGCYKELANKLCVQNGQQIHIHLEQKPESITYIKKKLNGEKLSYNELFSIISDIVDNKLSDIEITYFVAACHTTVMTMGETINLTKAMIKTGEVLKFNNGPVIDKHCVGGVAGNRTTMVVVPILIAAGLRVPKTSSRSITSPAGTADTMEVLTRVTLNSEEMKNVVAKTGGCIIWGGAISLAPADDKIIKVEHPVSIDSRAQLLASIMAKKASVGATHVLVDIPVGRGAKIENKKKALELKKQFEIVGRSVGMKIKAIITDGSEPIGNGMGPALEARDVLFVLRNDLKSPKDLKDKSAMIAGLILEMAGKAKKGEGKKKALELIKSGKAYVKFQEIITAQGGKEILPEEIGMAKYSYDIIAGKNGKIKHIDNEIIAKIARVAGAPYDKQSGLYLYKHKYDVVKKGEKLYTVYSNNMDRLDFTKKIVKASSGVEIK